MKQLMFLILGCVLFLAACSSQLSGKYECSGRWQQIEFFPGGKAEAMTWVKDVGDSYYKWNSTFKQNNDKVVLTFEDGDKEEYEIVENELRYLGEPDTLGEGKRICKPAVEAKRE